MAIIAIINLIFFSALVSLLYQLSKNKSFTLSRRVFMGLVGGSVFGMYLQLAFGANLAVMDATLEWTNVIANGYVALLRMMIMPLILITMIAAVLKVEEIKSLGKIGGTVVGTLIVTTVIAALIGIMMAAAFQLNADDLVGGATEMARAEVLQARQGSVADLSLAELLVSFVPTNIFSDLAGERSMSIIGVVVFGLIFGVAALLVSEENDEQGSRITNAVDTLQAIIMRLVKLVMALTPYGVLALMTRVIATSDGNAIMNLISFVIASYMAIALMFTVHAVIIIGLGANIKTYFQKVWPVLTFAFVTRSSAATIPLTIRAQIEELNVPAPIANIAASFGATIGQNGCAGIYPAMLAVMVADWQALAEYHMESIGRTLIAPARSADKGVGGDPHDLADLEVAFGLFGFFGDSPSAALVEKRRELFAGVAHHHHYAAARSIADLVSEDLLRLAPDDAASQGLPA